MQTLDFVSGLLNCLESSQPLSCLYQAMQTRKTFSIAEISYAITSWDSVYANHIKKSKQKKIMLFDLCSFPPCMDQNQTASALPLPNLVDLVTVKNIYKLQRLNITHQWY